MTARTLAMLALAVAAAACGSKSHRVPVVTDYDQTCATDDDCVTVFVGKPGCCPNCPNAAVRAIELQRVRDDDQKVSACQTEVFCPSMELLCGHPGPALCAAGTCQLWKHPTTISVDAYDRSCTSLADCAAVFVGSSCCGSNCPNAAIRSSAVRLLTSDLADAKLCDPPMKCEAPQPCGGGRIQCIAGVCQLEMPRRDGGVSDAASDDAAAQE